jgi:hypothetical protein
MEAPHDAIRTVHLADGQQALASSVAHSAALLVGQPCMGTLAIGERQVIAFY